MTPEMREIDEQLKALEERVNALSPLAETAVRDSWDQLNRLRLRLVIRSLEKWLKSAKL